MELPKILLILSKLHIYISHFKGISHDFEKNIPLIPMISKKILARTEVGILLQFFHTLAKI